MTAKAFNMRDVYRYSAKFLLYVTVPAGCAYYLKEDNWFIKTYRDMVIYGCFLLLFSCMLEDS